MKRTISWLAICLLVGIAYLSPVRAAETSQVLPFTGCDASLPDTVDLRLRLFTAASGGAPVFEETQTGVGVDAATGCFSLRIGEATGGGLPTALFRNNPSLWIAFALASAPDAELGSGRTPIASMGYAHFALTPAGPAGPQGPTGPMGPAGPGVTAGATISGSTENWIGKFTQSGRGSALELEQAPSGEGDLIRGVNATRQCTGPASVAGRSCTSDSSCMVGTGRCGRTFTGDWRCGVAPPMGPICTTDADCRGTCQPPQTVFRVAKNGDTFFSGNVGIGTSTPGTKLEVRGHLTLEAAGSPGLYTGTGGAELNRYLALLNSPASPSASGLKAGGILVADSYDYANPGKNDLIVKGNVGIGTASPDFNLDVRGTIRALYDEPLFIMRNPPDLFAGTTCPVGPPPFGVPRPPCYHSFRVDGFGSVRTSGKLGVNGLDSDDGYPRGWAGGIHAFDIYAEGSVGLGRGGALNAVIGSDGVGSFKVLRINGGADLSEQFDVRGTQDAGRDASPGHVEPGMVVSIDPDNPGKLVVSAQAYDRRVAGIISGAGGVQPGMLMGQSGTLADGQHPVALTGRVYVWADAYNGAIAPGDLLTTSNVPGHAMKVTDPSKAQGAILGKAMTGLKEGKDLVLVLVTLQ